MALRWVWASLLAVAVVLGLADGGVASVPSPKRDPAFVDLALVSPRPVDAAGDLPHIYGSRCHTHGWSVVRLCQFGDRDARKVMVAFGDSHMAQWHAALNRAAKLEGYQLRWASKGGCPAATVRVPADGSPEECNWWRRQLLRKIVALPRLDLVVMASSSWIPIYYPGTFTAIGTEAEREEAWGAGMEKTIRRLKGRGRRVMVIRDTPRLWVDAPSCLLSSGGETRPCSHDRTGTLLSGNWAQIQRLTATFPRVRAVQFTSAFCTRSRCRPVTSSYLLRFRDDNHMTNTFSSALTGRVRSRIRAVMK